MIDKYLDVSKAQFMAFQALPIDGPLQMLNLLKFKKEIVEAGISGEQQYNLYMKATLPFFQKSKAKVLFYGAAQFNLIGPQDQLEWDKVLIVEYATKADFIQMITAKGYPAELRKRALEDSRLIFCSPVKK